MQKLDHLFINKILTRIKIKIISGVKIFTYTKKKNTGLISRIF